jgi:pimeloyl-ACP methyl ester carboxylesterase
MTMRRLCSLMVFLALLCGSSIAAAAPTPGACSTGAFLSKAIWQICVPSTEWNGGLIVWAHGYVAPNQPLSIGNTTLPDGTSLPDFVQAQGYAFATTSYRRNGLAVLEGIQDIRDLMAKFPSVAGKPATRTYLIGASEGGLVTTLLLERYPRLFSGGMALCGPIGDFQKQIEYLGDMRVLFDYFFPGPLPPTPINIPPNVLADWENVYQPAIKSALTSNPISTTQLISTSLAAVVPGNLTTYVSSTLEVLWYNVFATNDARGQLGDKNPYGNVGHEYTGSSDDTTLNASVQRFAADPAALAALDNYQTSGLVHVPLILMHTSDDPVVPDWHMTKYMEKVQKLGTRDVTPIRVNRYGHCAFSAAELLPAFITMVQQAASVRPQIYLPFVSRS